MIKAIGMFILIIGNLSYTKSNIESETFYKGSCEWPGKHGGICGRQTASGKKYCNRHLHGSS